MTHPFKTCGLYKSVFDVPSEPIRATKEALAAVRAMKNRHIWGYHAALMYAVKMQVPPMMFFLVNDFEDRREQSNGKR